LAAISASYLIIIKTLYFMSTLDNPNQPTIDASTVSPLPGAVRNGLLGGLILIVYGLFAIFTDLASPAKGFGAIALNLLISVVLYVGIVVYGVRYHRDQELGGFITFGRAFITGLIVVVVAGILGAVFNYVYMSFIDPDYMARMMEDMGVMYERLGMTEEQIEEAMAQVEGSMSPARTILTAILSSAIIGGIVSLIVAAVMKREPAEAV
jgi:hypothetical protein